MTSSLEDSSPVGAESVRTEIEKIFRMVLANEQLELSDTLHARDITGWNSLNHVRIIVEIEKKFRVHFKPKEVVGLNYFGDLITTVTRKILLNNSTPSSG